MRNFAAKHHPFMERKDYFLHDFSEDHAAGDVQSDSVRPEGGPEPATAPRRRRGVGLWFWMFVAVALCAALYVRYFVPCASDLETVGYVTRVEKRGVALPTWECEMVSEAALADTSRVYQRDFNFSIPDEALARQLQACQGTGKRVRVTTKRYYGALPWRGASKAVLTALSPEDTPVDVWD